MFIAPSDLKLFFMSFLLPSLLVGKAVKKAKNSLSKNPPQSSFNVYNPDLSLHGSDYQTLAANNPYANVSYRQSWIQKLLESLGFRTNKDSYLESMALQAKEYDNQLLQKEYNETYDSPIEQAKRESLAGLNPDLTGNISSGESAAPVDDGNPPIAPEADDLNLVQQFASGILNGVQAAFGLYGQIQSIDQLKMQNEGSMMNLVKSAWSMLIPDWYDNFNNDGVRTSIDVNKYWNNLHQKFGHSMSKRQFSRFVDRVNSFANSAEGWKMVYDTQTNKAKARKSMFREFADESYSEWDDVMSLIGDELGNLAFRVNKLTLQGDEKYQGELRPEELANKLEYQQALDPNRMVQNEMTISDNEAAISGFNRQMAEYQNLLRGSFKGIMSKLESLENKGSKVAPIVKAVLSVWLMGMMPSVSFSRTAGKFGMSTSASIK